MTTTITQEDYDRADAAFRRGDGLCESCLIVQVLLRHGIRCDFVGTTILQLQGGARYELSDSAQEITRTAPSGWPALVGRTIELNLPPGRVTASPHPDVANPASPLASVSPEAPTH